MWKRILPLLVLTSVAGAQTYTISTVAGGGPVTGQGATVYGLNTPTSVAADLAGNLYIALYYQCQVWVVNSGGQLSQVIGNGTCGFSGDGGPPALASLNRPYGVAVDSSGNIYIADTNNARIRRVSGGIITTVAGNGTVGFTGDGGSAISAGLAYPAGVAVDTAGNLYIADTYNFRIRKVSGGVITTVAGNGTEGYNGDGIIASSAELNLPWAVAVDGSGNLYIADTANNRVREVSSGFITTVAGTGAEGYNGDGITATSAELSSPYGVAVDSSGNVYIADTYNDSVREVSGFIIRTAAVTVSGPEGVAVAGNNVYVADTGNNRIGKVSSGGVTTVVGNGLLYSGDGGPAPGAEILSPYGLAVDGSGNLFIADSGDCVVRKVAAGTGIISTVAGNGTCGYNGDNISATSAQLANPFGLALDSSGNLFIADHDNNRIRRVSGGTITTVAGDGTADFRGDGGSAIFAQLNGPYGVAVDSSGNLFIADTSNQRIRKVSGGIITTVTGIGAAGYNGDSIGATSALLSYPLGVAVDGSGNIFIADSYNNRIRKVSGGVITTVAGNGIVGYMDNINAIASELAVPIGVAVDNSGNLYIADSINERIRLVSSGFISPIAGNGIAGFSGDGGAATGAELNNPAGVALDSSGNVYVADLNNNRVRQLHPTGLIEVTVTSLPMGLTVVVDGAQLVTPATVNSPPGLCHTFNAGAQSGPPGIQYLPVGAFPVSQCYSANGSFNVNFTPQFFLNTSATPGGTISPPSGFYNPGATVSVSATPNAGYTFVGFSGALTGAANPQSVFMGGPEAVTANFLAPPYTISGQVITAAGLGLSGVTINVTGSQTLSMNTNASGSYIFALPGGGTYTVSASLSGYSFTASITISNLSANQTANFTGTPVAGLDFYPVTPCRIVDTRTGAGFSGQFGPPTLVAGATRPFSILSSACASSIPSTAAAYSLNFTAIPPGTGSAANLTTWPVGQPMPNASTLNYSNFVVANAAIVPAGAGGAIDVFVTNPTDMAIDIDGYFAPPQSSGLEFFPVTPCRIADTRTYGGSPFAGQYGQPSLGAGATRQFYIPATGGTSPANNCGIPTTASAYSLNFTAIPPGGGPAANLTTWPGTQPMPNVSSLNFYSNVIANAAFVPAASNGEMNVFVSASTNLLIDTNGYFAPAQSSGYHFYPLPPCRIADTRSVAGFTGQFGPPTIATGQTRTFAIPQSSCEVPSTAAAYSLNFTVIPPSIGQEANLTTWPVGTAMPNVSTLNYYGGVLANAAIVPAGTSGAINVFVAATTDVVIDIDGYFAP